jgi:aminotransferase
MDNLISERSKRIIRSEIFEMMALASKYNNVINFGVGEPHFDTPESIIEYSFNEARGGYTHYTVNAGDIKLREAIARKLDRENGIKVDPEREIIVTIGGIEALLLLWLALVNPGDEVIIQDPSWINFNSQILLVGGIPIKVPVKEENNFALKAKDIEERVTDKTKLVLINSPSNPTGGVTEKEELIKIGKLALKYKFILVLDETYEKIFYEGEHYSLGSRKELRDHVVNIFSFSKTYAMTGWRVGFAAGPENIIKEMIKIHDSVGLCTPSISQSAAFAALKVEKEVEEMVESYRENRDILVKGLNKINCISCLYPAGTFYAFANVKKLGKSALDLSRDILDKVQVVTIDGSSFGEAGEGYLRFTFATSKEHIYEGLERINNYVEKYL